jgi:hypothetical protein
MSILNDLGKLVERDIEDDIEAIEREEEDRPNIKKIASKVVDDDESEERSSGSDVGEILKHIDNVKAAAEFIDTLTTDEANTTAFEAEIALRKALQKMQDLSDESYKKKGQKNIK